MRIISDFKDYYDSALSFGSDPNLIYFRTRKEFEFNVRDRYRGEGIRIPHPMGEVLRTPLDYVSNLPHHFLEDKFGSRLSIPITTKVIGFCGFFYAAIEIDGTVYHSIDQIKTNLSSEFLKQFSLKRKDLEALLFRGCKIRWKKYSSFKERWENVVANFSGKRFDEVFIALSAPVFKLEYAATQDYYSSDTVRGLFNPSLSPDSFWKIKPSTDAFQEISMYLGNQLARQPEPVVNISDEILRDEKGFDSWSFRRHKEEDAKCKKEKLSD